MVARTSLKATSHVQCLSCNQDGVTSTNVSHSVVISGAQNGAHLRSRTAAMFADPTQQRQNRPAEVLGVSVRHVRGTSAKFVQIRTEK
jgi:hypothetical protein